MTTKASNGLHEQQECIPVGCVPAGRRQYAGVCFPGGGGCLLLGGLLQGGWRLGGLPPGGSALGGCLRGVSAPGGYAPGGWCLLLGGLSALGGLLPGGVCSWGVASQHALRETPPVNRMNDRQVLPWP